MLLLGVLRNVRVCCRCNIVALWSYALTDKDRTTTIAHARSARYPMSGGSRGWFGLLLWLRFGVMLCLIIFLYFVGMRSGLLCGLLVVLCSGLLFGLRLIADLFKHLFVYVSCLCYWLVLRLAVLGAFPVVNYKVALVLLVLVVVYWLGGD